MDFFKLLQLLFAKRKTILPIAAVIFCVLTFFSIFKSPSYKASGLVMLEKKEPFSVAPIGLSVEAYLAYIKTNIVMMESRPVVEKVIDVLKLNEKKPGMLDKVKQLVFSSDKEEKKYIEKDSKEYAQIVKWVQELITIRPVRLTNLVEVTVTFSEAKKAAAIVNALVNAYISWVGELNSKEATQLLSFINEQLREQKEKLEAIQQKLSVLQKKVGAIAPDEEEELGIKKLIELKARLLEIRNKLSEARAISATISKDNLDTVSFLYLLEDHPSVLELRRKLINVETNLLVLSDYWKESHPQIINLKKESGRIKEKLYVEVSRSLSEEILLLESRLKNLTETITTYQHQLVTVSDDMVELSYLRSEMMAARKLYVHLLQEQKKNQLLESKNTVEDIRFIEPAVPPFNPEGIGFLKRMVINALFGLMVAMGLTIFLHYYSLKNKC